MSILDGLKTCRKGLHQYSADLKRCPQCHKDAAEAWRDKNKEYSREYGRQRYAENKEKYAEKNRNRARDWAQKNPEKKRESDQRYYQKNRDKINNQMKKWVAKNPEKSLEIKRRWRENNPDKVREIYKLWSQRNRDKNNAKSAKRRAFKKQAIATWADLKEIKKIYEECARLTRETGVPHEVDHIFPLQSEYMCGLHVENNLQILTLTANREKGNVSWPGQLECQKDPKALFMRVE